MRRVWLSVLAGLVVMLAAPIASALTVKDLITLRGTGETNLWGFGLVMGLEGTGDSGDYLPMARQMARVLERGGNVIPDLAELLEAQNVAVVMVTATLPREGARVGETYDVFVQAVNNASSLRGGRLFITPLLGPLPGQGVYGFAEGPITFEEDAIDTTGRVRGGLRMARDITMQTVDQNFRLVLQVRPEYAGWNTTKLLANTINQDRQGLLGSGAEVAQALDEKIVVVTIPEPERRDPANFIGSILDIRMDPSLLSLPARVIVNERVGSIVLQGDVQISPAVVSHGDLVVTTVTPPVEPTPEAPRVEVGTAALIATEVDGRRMARAGDLLQAMDTLDVPIEDQIAIVTQLHRIGALHAELIVE